MTKRPVVVDKDLAQTERKFNLMLANSPKNPKVREKQSKLVIEKWQ